MILIRSPLKSPQIGILSPLILSRYVFSEMLKYFLLAFGGLSSLIFIAITLGELHKMQGISLVLVQKILPLFIPDVLLLTIPASLLLAVTFTIGRLASDNEINAMRANGVHLGHVLTPGLLLGAILAIVCGWLVEFGIPSAQYQRRNLVGRALEGLTEAAGTGGGAIRIGKNSIRYKDSREGALIEADIFLMDHDENVMIRAREARLILDEDNARLVLDLRDAMVTWDTKHTKKDVQSDLMFERMTQDIDVSDRFVKERRMVDLPMDDLWILLTKRKKSRFSTEELSTEFHRRLAWASAPFFFALAAGPLAMLLRKGGRVAGLAAVVLPVFAVFFPLAIMGQRMGEQDVIPSWIGAWACDAALAGIGLGTFRKFVRL